MPMKIGIHGFCWIPACAGMAEQTDKQTKTPAKILRGFLFARAADYFLAAA
jgi:hypothetical protein